MPDRDAGLIEINLRMKDISTPLIDAAREQRERFWAEADAEILAMR